MDGPETHYAKTEDGLHIAYQVIGDGPLDIFFDPYMTCLEVMWDEPSFAHCLQRVAKIGRLIMLEHLGIGGSDPVSVDALPAPEKWMDDIRVVLDTVGSESACIMSQGSQGLFGMLFAATYPERTRALVLIDAWARTFRDVDYPFGMQPESAEGILDYIEQRWGTGSFVSQVAPGRIGDEAFRLWHARRERVAISPGFMRAANAWMWEFDVREILPTIRTPTLVLNQQESRTVSVDAARYLADHMPAAKLVLVPVAGAFLYSDRADDTLDLIEEFITGAPPVRESDRALATVLFTDIVSSTERAAGMGDRRWAQLLDQHDALVARELERHRGRKVNPTGDGMLATFDGPARAIRCAQSIVAGIVPLGIEVRAGLHAGEVELRGEDIGGIAVHIGQRVSSLAGAGEVLVSSTVKDLVAGSGIAFADRGTHALKGVPDEWRIFAVEA